MVKNCEVCHKEFNTKYVTQKVCGEDCRIIKIKRERPSKKNKLDEVKMKTYLQTLSNYDRDLAQWMIDNPITRLPDGSTTIYGSPTNPNIKIRLYKERLYKNWQIAR